MCDIRQVLRIMAAILVAGCCGLTTSMCAADVFLHQGNADPLTEGWLHNEGRDSLVGPLTWDMGYDAWYVDDNSTISGSADYYYQLLTLQQTGAGLSAGWQATIRVRMPELADTMEGSVSFSYSTENWRWQLNFGSDNLGSQTVLARTDDVYPPMGVSVVAGGAGYHLYEIVFDPEFNSADVFIDGAERITDWHGFELFRDPYISFGSMASSDIGQGNYNLVRFEILPEPATVAFVGAGLVGIVARARKKRSTRGRP